MKIEGLKQPKKLKNGIIYENNEIENGRMVQIYAYPSTNATTAWIQFQFLNETGNFNSVKFTFNFVNFTMKYKSGDIERIEAWKGPLKMSDENDPFGNERVEIGFIANRIYKFYVKNIVMLNFTIFEEISGNIFTVYSGGKWKHVSGNKKNSEAIYPRKISKKLSCQENFIKPDPNLNITDIQRFFADSSNDIITKKQPNPNFTFYISSFENYETKTFEFRESLCPGSDAMKFDITIVKRENKVYGYPSVWIRQNLKWEKMFNLGMEKPFCTKIEIRGSQDYIKLSCGYAEARLNNIFGRNMKYFIQEKSKKFICNK
uniref:Allorecognition 2 n=1 Tax=Panagrolaimus sp. PS1159 TaxID=55785 RepID=A0AC35FBL7_9BILA